MRFKAMNGRRRYVGRGQRLYTVLMDILLDNAIPILSAIISSIVAIGSVVYNNRKTDQRREVDDKRRDRERLEQVRREDYASQRRAVSEYVRKMREVETERRAGPADLPKYSQLFERYRDYLEDLDLEITHPEVRKCLEEWQRKNDEAASKLLKFRYDHGGRGLPPDEITYVIYDCPEDLQRSAKEHLHIPYDYDQLEQET